MLRLDSLAVVLVLSLSLSLTRSPALALACSLALAIAPTQLLAARVKRGRTWSGSFCPQRTLESTSGMRVTLFYTRATDEFMAARERGVERATHHSNVFVEWVGQLGRWHASVQHTGVPAFFL
jgi:hypothetical protein